MSQLINNCEWNVRENADGRNMVDGGTLPLQLSDELHIDAHWCHWETQLSNLNANAVSTNIVLWNLCKLLDNKAELLNTDCNDLFTYIKLGGLILR
jgi:hypothetical protein